MLFRNLEANIQRRQFRPSVLVGLKPFGAFEAVLACRFMVKVNKNDHFQIKHAKSTDNYPGCPSLKSDKRCIDDDLSDDAVVKLPGQLRLRRRWSVFSAIAERSSSCFLLLSDTAEVYIM